MSISQLITRSRPFRFNLQKNSKGLTGSGGDFKGPFVLDITDEETTNLEAEVTQLPVEEGPDVNDHIKRKPVTVEVSGFVSETPLNLESSLQGLVGGAGGAVGNLLGGFGAALGNAAGGYIGSQVFGSSQDPAQAARDALEDLFEKGERVTVVTKRKVYTDMVMTSLRFPRNASSGEGLVVQMRFQKMNMVQATVVTLKNLARSASSSAAAKSKLGNQTPKAPNAEQSAKGSSILFKLKSAVGL